MAEAGLNVIIPLGGLGTRFQKEGYLTRPKPFVPVLGTPMILWVLESLALSESDTLVIVYNPSFMSLGNFMREVVGGAYPACKFVELPGPTRGAAETVLFGLRALEEPMRKRPTLLADGDTFYTANIVGMFREVAQTHNACFCFCDTQPNPIYSYITIGESDNITEVREKVKISDWANSGCYCFRDGSQLEAECAALIDAKSTQESQDGVGEYYTSGVISAMLAKQEPFRALKLETSDIHVLGTPAQVKAFCETWHTQPRKRFVFDLEGALRVGTRGEAITRNIEICKRLKRQGHSIVVQSTQPWGMQRQTWKFLEEHGIPCDELAMEKPRGDFYVGGPNVLDGLLADLDMQTGFYPTEVQASRASGVARHRQSAPPRKPKMSKVGALHPSSQGVNCVLRVLGVPTEVDSAKRGARRFWEVTCGDETAKVVLSLTEAQKEGLDMDRVVIVRNGHIRMINNFMRLCVDKWGKVDLDPAGATIDEVGETNMSLAEYDRVEV